MVDNVIPLFGKHNRSQPKEPESLDSVSRFYIMTTQDKGSFFDPRPGDLNLSQSYDSLHEALWHGGQSDSSIHGIMRVDFTNNEFTHIADIQFNFTRRAEDDIAD